jgi:hypothetical protein
MGGRRSRYWCGPGFSRETKLAPGRGFTGQWSAPTFFVAPAASAAGVHRKGKTKLREEGKNENSNRNADHLHKRDSLDARNVKPLSASEILAHGLRVDQQHVALRLRELRTVAFIRASRQPVLLRPHDVIQLVGILRLAPRAIQRSGLLRLRFRIIRAFVHFYLSAIGTHFMPSGLPLYSARGRIRRLL